MKSTIIYFLILINTAAFSQNKLPQIILKNLEGTYTDISKINTNTITVFSFWATWCVPCINELEAINDEYSAWQKETNVKIIAVSIDDTRTSSRVKPLINGFGWEFPILFDINQEFKRAVNVTAIPYLIIVKNNTIVYAHAGYTPGYEFELFNKIKEYAH